MPGEALGRLGELDELTEVLGGGDDRAVAGEAYADAGDLDMRERSRALQEGGQRSRHHALAKVAHVDHRDDAVSAVGPGRCRVQRGDHVDLAHERDVSERDGLIGEGGSGRAQQPERARDSGLAHSRDVLQARLTQRRDAPRQHRAGDLGRAAGDLRDADDLDPGKRRDHRAGVLFDLAQVDGERGHIEHESVRS